MICSVSRCCARYFREPGRPFADRLLAAAGSAAAATARICAISRRPLQRGEPDRVLRQVEAGSLLRLCVNDPVILSEQHEPGDDRPPRRQPAVARGGGGSARGESAAGRRTAAGQALREDSQPEVRRRAARALGRTHQAGAFAAPGEAIDDQNREVRLSVLRSLGDVGASLKIIPRRQPTKRRGRACSKPHRPRSERRSGGAGHRFGDAVAAGRRAAARASASRLRRNRCGDAAAGNGSRPRGILEQQRKGPPPLLDHPDFAVRMQAAAGWRRSGIAAAWGLREALSRGEAEAIQAYGLLTKLGEAVRLPPVDDAASEQRSENRLAAIEAVLHLPLELALSYSPKRAAIPDRVVRRRVVELVGICRWAAGWLYGRRALAAGCRAIRTRSSAPLSDRRCWRASCRAARRAQPLPRRRRRPDIARRPVRRARISGAGPAPVALIVPDAGVATEEPPRPASRGRTAAPKRPGSGNHCDGICGERNQRTPSTAKRS